MLSLQTGYSAEVEQAYLDHLAKYGKQFGARSNNDVPTSFKNFAKSYEQVKKHNAKADRMYDMELNQFADMTASDFKNLKPEIDQLLKVNPPSPMPNMLVTQVQNSWDWSKSTKLAPVYDQLSCNADWAISAVETLESAIAISKNISIAEARISVQHLIDCDTTNVGCVGGWPARAWKFFQKSGYVAPEDYPYKQYLGAKRQCLAIKDKSAIQKLDSEFRGRQYVTLKVDQLKQLVQIQPLSVSINAPQCFRLYKSGILSQYDCDCNSVSFEEVEVNEIVTIVGFGATEQTDKEYTYCSGYWIVRPSYGPNWGENGYARLCIPRNRETTDFLGTCNVQTYPALPDTGLLKSIQNATVTP